MHFLNVGSESGDLFFFKYWSLHKLALELYLVCTKQFFKAYLWRDQYFLKRFQDSESAWKNAYNNVFSF